MTGLEFGADGPGYAVCRGLLGPAVIERLGAAFAALGVPAERSRFVSTIDCDRAAAIDVDLLVRAELAVLGSELAGDVEPFLGAFISKGAAGGAAMEFHQDWTYTDERHERAVFAWIPLVDVGEDNGAMYVVPGSQAWSAGIRPSANDAAPPTDDHLDGFARMATRVDMVAGDVLLYDPALVHGTPPNRTGRPRPVAAIAFAPVGASVLHFRTVEDGSIEGVRLSRGEFYMDAFHGIGPVRPPVTPWADIVRPDDFAPHLPGPAESGSAGHDEQAQPRRSSTTGRLRAAFRRRPDR